MKSYASRLGINKAVLDGTLPRFIEIFSFRSSQASTQANRENADLPPSLLFCDLYVHGSFQPTPFPMEATAILPGIRSPLLQGHQGARDRH